MNKHAFWRGIICGITLGFVVAAARADTVTITIDPFTIDGVPPPVVHFAESRGPGLFQAVYKQTADGPDILIEARDGFPCTCRPLGQFQSYSLWDAAPVSLGLDPATTSVAFDANTIMLTDAAPIRTHPGDFNGDGVTSVQDIFDFLATVPTPDEVFAFLDGWFSPPPPPPPIGCPCLLSDYPLVFTLQGPASDACYEDYKWRTIEAYDEFLARVYRDCRITGTTCWKCSCVLQRYLEWQIQDQEFWEACE